MDSLRMLFGEFYNTFYTNYVRYSNSRRFIGGKTGFVELLENAKVLAVVSVATEC